MIELTEQSVDHGRAAARALEQIRTLGVAVGLDDFGTGESALSLIRTLPVDFVKIDRHFVRGMHSHRADRAIVASVIELARRLELDVVAEGIESERDAEVLRDLGCTFGQGFLYSKAVPLDQLADVADAITVRGVLDRSNR